MQANILAVAIAAVANTLTLYGFNSASTWRHPLHKVFFVSQINRQIVPADRVRDHTANSLQGSSFKHTFQEFNQFSETLTPTTSSELWVEVKDAGESTADAII